MGCLLDQIKDLPGSAHNPNEDAEEVQVNETYLVSELGVSQGESLGVGSGHRSGVGSLLSVYCFGGMMASLVGSRAFWYMYENEVE